MNHIYLLAESRTGEAEEASQGASPERTGWEFTGQVGRCGSKLYSELDKALTLTIHLPESGLNAMSCKEGECLPGLFGQKC